MARGMGGDFGAETAVRSIEDFTIETFCLCLGRSLDCYVPSTEARAAIWLLFVALGEGGWEISPPLASPNLGKRNSLRGQYALIARSETLYMDDKIQ